MKKIFSHIILICVFTIAIFTSGSVYGENIAEKSLLLETYIERYKSQITENSRKYGIRNDEIIQRSITTLKKFESQLEQLQKEEISESDARKELTTIVQELKQIHTEVKEYLEQAQQKHFSEIQEKRDSYTKVSQLVQVRTERLISVISGRLVEKEELSNTEKKIIKSLLNMRRHNERLKNFYVQDFNSPEEVEVAFLGIIRDIRSELVRVKLLLK